MESIENPNTRTLRVMRFKFEANEPLREQVALQLEEKQRHLGSLAFYGSRQLMLSVSDYYKREGDLQRIGRRFRNFSEPIHLRPVTRSREINEYTTRLQFAPVEQDAFDAITSLDPVPFAGQYEHDRHQLPNMITDQPDRGHYLFVDVSTDALLSVNQRKMANMALTNEIEASKLWLHTLALSTVRDIHLRGGDKETIIPGEVRKAHNDDEFERAG